MARNFLGLDVHDLDVGSFLLVARLVFPFLALLWLAAAGRIRKPVWLLAGVLAAQAHAWAATNYPLGRLYALGPSRDRIGNLGLSQVVASGNSPLRTTQVGQLHFEPFWGLLVAATSGFDPERVIAIYPYFSLVMALAFPLAIYVGLRPVEKDGSAWSGWERALMAGFMALLSSSALDYVATFRVPWARAFLLKPNHALGLVLFPLFLGLFVRIRGLRDRIVAGLVLHLIGWAFVLHMVYVSGGLVVFAALSALARRTEARRDVLDVAVVIGVNALVVSPYILMLLVGYPFMVRTAAYGLPEGTTHLLEPAFQVGPLVWLAAWGAVVAYRRGDRLGRLWTSLLVAALAGWLAYLGLGALDLARERDELYYWLRFLIAGSAAIGAWDLAGRAAPMLSRRLAEPAWRAAAVALLALPFSVPYWWNPALMDSYFPGSLSPLPAPLGSSMDFLRRETDPRSVVAGDPALTRWAAALGARRGVIVGGMNATGDWERRWKALETLVREPDGDAARAAAAPYGIQYLLVDPGLLARYPPVTLAEIERRPHLQRVHFAGDPSGDFVAVFRLVDATTRD